MNSSPIHEKTWDEVELEMFSPEEREACRVQGEIMIELIKARQEKGISQRKLEEMTGIKQSVIARLETGKTSPKFETVLKILLALGKTFTITDFSPSKTAAPASIERSR